MPSPSISEKHQSVDIPFIPLGVLTSKRFGA